MGLGLKRKGRRRCVGVGGALFPVVVGLTPSAQEQGMEQGRQTVKSEAPGTVN